MKKDFLFQRQHDDVREMLEKQVILHYQVVNVVNVVEESKLVII